MLMLLGTEKPVIRAVLLAPTPAIIGNPITATVKWNIGPKLGISYQWSLDDEPIEGATSANYVPILDDDGGTLKCTVTIRTPAGTATRTSAGTLVVVSISGGGFSFGFSSGFQITG